MNKSYLITFLVSVAFIFLAFVFQDKLSQFKSLGLLGIFLINFFGSATIFIPSPAIVSVFAGGAVYGVVAVAIVASIGAALGDMLGFFIGDSGKHILLQKDNKWFRLGHEYFIRYGGLFVFVFALIPNPLFDGVGLIAGALGYSRYRFFVILFVGRLLRNFLVAFAGSAFAN